jgi:hypothetical protein
MFMSEKFEGKAADGGSAKTNPFLQFLTSFETVPNQIVDAMIRQAPDEEHRIAINAYGDALRVQVQGLCAFMRESASRLTPQGQEEVSRFASISGGAALISGIGAFSKSIGSTLARIGIADIVAELKKIIDRIFEIFHIHRPDWLTGLEALINEILHDLLALGFLGLRSVLSRMHQDYLSEQILITRLQREHAMRDPSASNDLNFESA